jgi:biopolymer transport protein ExbD
MAGRLTSGGPDLFGLKQNSDINVTPFVDVMLVLLIIFMVAIPVATTSIRLDLPKAERTAAKPKDPVLINIQMGGGLFIGERPTSLPALAADLARTLTADNPALPPTDQRVYVRADKRVRYGEFMSVMNTLQGNGFYQVALINEEL